MKQSIDAHPEQKRLVYFTTQASAFLSHRLNLGLEALARGYEVHVVCYADASFRRLEAYGIQVHNLKHMRRGSLNPLRILLLVAEVWRLYRSIHPCLVHHVAQQPVICGTMAARLAGVRPIVNVLGGLGYIFTEEVGRRPSFLKRFLRGCLELTWTALFTPPDLRIIVQNPCDKEVVETSVDPKKIVLIPGAGVNLEAFPEVQEPTPTPGGGVRVVMAARLLWDKGVQEFASAARLLKARYPGCVFILAGDIDAQNPRSLSMDDVATLRQTHYIEIVHGASIASLYADSHIVVLPSYREGMPRSLLEACATARPIVTTDVPGCRDVVVDGVNGFVVPPQSVHALVGAIEKLILDPQLRASMGRESRQRAVRYYADSIIVQKTFDVYNEVMSKYDILAQAY